MNRAFSLFETKSLDNEQRIVEGIATSITPDRVSDIVVPRGLKFALPLPLLHQHNANEPVGHVTHAIVTDQEIKVTAQFVKPTADMSESLIDRLNTAWGEVKPGLVRAFSIGFSPITSKALEDGGFQYDEADLLELSLVTIPANAEATIQTVKSYDRIKAALGTDHVVVRLDERVIAHLKASGNRPGAYYL